jgi:ubiquinone/menaquinone biosynthesis C-methylase UbiE
METKMNPWEDIFKKNGRVFETPHTDMPGIARLMKEHGAKKVLDLGNGTGRHTVYMAKNGFEVYGFDQSPEAIQSTQKWLSEEGLTAQFMQGDMNKKLPYKDGFFDAVITVKVINHGTITSIKKIAKEISRVLKPGGILFVVVITVKNMAKNWKEVEPGTFIPLDGREKGLIHHFFTEEELRDVFSGFEITHLHLDKERHYCMTAFKK